MSASSVCSSCARPPTTTLPIRLSIDCATSTYTSLNSAIALCQDCLDALATPTISGADVTIRALAAATDRFHQIVHDRQAPQMWLALTPS